MRESKVPSLLSRNGSTSEHGITQLNKKDNINRTRIKLFVAMDADKDG